MTAADAVKRWLNTAGLLYPNESSPLGVGASIRPPDADGKLAGQFSYATDVTAPGALHAVTVRSTVARARLQSVPVADALAVEGVVTVLTAADVPGSRYVGLKVSDQAVFAGDEIRFCGEPIALVVAETRHAAQAGANAIEPELTPQPALLDPERGLDADAPLVAGDSNLVAALQLRHGPARRGRVSIRGTWHTGRQDPAFLAPESGLAIPDPDGGVTLHVATQDLHSDRRQIAFALGLEESRVRLRLAGVGGAFGGREDITLHVHLCLAALRTGRPVRMTYSRAESLGAHPGRHPTRLMYELTADPDGTLVSLRADLLLDGGAFASTSEPICKVVHYMSAGAYRIPSVDVSTRAVCTNNPPAGAMRGFGATQACFGIESAMDMLAAELRMDPIELRRRNLLTAGEPLSTSGQPMHGTCDPRTLMDACLAVPLPDDDPSPGHRRGIGFAFGIKHFGLGDGRPEGAAITLHCGTEGVEVRSSAPEVGQGITAVLTQVVQQALGPVPVRVMQPRSEYAVSGASKASRQSFVSGGAAALAAQELKGCLDERARHLGHTGYRPELLAELVASAPIEVTSTYTAPPTQAPDRDGRGNLSVGFQLTANRAVVDVDPEFGTAALVQLVAGQDVGRAVNPDQIRGQLVGGAVQGAGFALFEEIALDAGRPDDGGFASYLIPTAGDVPSVIPVVVENPDPSMPHGIKGVGEGPLVSSPAAVAAALRAASGRTVNSLPAHPDDLMADA